MSMETGTEWIEVPKETTIFNGNSPHTSCKACCFALRVNGDGPQFGCSLGRTEVFKELDCLTPVYDEDGDEFFVVKDRCCHAFRDEGAPWAQEHKTDRVAVVREELKLKLSLLVLLEDGLSEQMLAATCQAIKGQVQGFHEVHFVNRQQAITPGKLNALLWRSLENAVTWRITSVLGETGRWEAVDRAVARITGGYYGVFEAGFAIPSDFVSSLNSSIVDRLERFSVLTPVDEVNGLVVQTSLHRHQHIDGNKPASITTEDGKTTMLNSLVEKVGVLADSLRQQHMVRRIGDVVLSLHSEASAAAS